LETLLTGPGFDQGPIDREVLVGHQALGPLDHAAEKAPGDLLIEQPVAILREHRWRPHGLVHRQANEPPKQQVVIELLHQQSLAANRVEDLQQLRLSRRSGGIDGRPIAAYRRSNSRDMSRSTSSTKARIARNAWDQS
jgi:hypothetical protein